MLQIALVIVLAVLWVLTVTQLGGTDFLRVTALQVGDKSFKVTDFAIGLVIVAISPYWGISRNDFVNYDDQVYITQNPNLDYGLSAAGIKWHLGLISCGCRTIPSPASRRMEISPSMAPAPTFLWPISCSAYPTILTRPTPLPTTCVRGL